MLKILFFGDIMGRIGRKGIQEMLPKYKKKYAPDLIVANVENLAHGKSITKNTLDCMVEAGINFFTSGNHIYKKTEALEILSSKKYNIIRPANYPESAAGDGYRLIEVGTKKILMINLMGRVFIREDFECPFQKLDSILKKFAKKKLNAVIVDFHAEATSEKIALAHYADGRVSAILGTHTHVATADQRILEDGTAFVSDAGFVGATDSVIGVDKQDIIRGFLTQLSQPHNIPEEGDCTINAVLVEINPRNGKAESIKRVDTNVKI